MKVIVNIWPSDNLWTYEISIGEKRLISGDRTSMKRAIKAAQVQIRNLALSCSDSLKGLDKLYLPSRSISAPLQ